MKNIIGLSVLSCCLVACSPSPQHSSATITGAKAPARAVSFAPVQAGAGSSPRNVEPSPNSSDLITRVSDHDLEMMKQEPIDGSGAEAHAQSDITINEDTSPNNGHPRRRMSVAIVAGPSDEVYLSCEDGFSAIGSHYRDASVGAPTGKEGGPSAAVEYDGAMRVLPIALDGPEYGWHVSGTKEREKFGDRGFAQVLAFFKIARAGKNLTLGHRRDFVDTADRLGQLIRFCESM